MNDEQLLRYSRHVFLPELDIKGQQALLSAHVLVVGLGGLGSPVAQYLAASGIGQLTLMDDDRVELSNLARQVVHTTARVGEYKVISAQQALMANNPGISITPVVARASADTLASLLPNVDLVVDCTDNARARYALNDACLQHGIPWVSAAAVGWQGHITILNPRLDKAPCYRCLHPNLHDQQLNCSESGVLSPLLGVLGSLQAVEAIKQLTGVGETLAGRLLTFDALRGDWRSWKVAKNPDCDACGAGYFKPSR